MRHSGLSFSVRITSGLLGFVSSKQNYVDFDRYEGISFIRYFIKPASWKKQSAPSFDIFRPREKHFISPIAQILNVLFEVVKCITILAD